MSHAAPSPAHSPDEIARHFTLADGSYRFARWGRPVAPVAFGIEDATVATLRAAIGAVAELTGTGMAETDPELGSNLMFFFFRDWAELAAVRDLDRLVPDLEPLTARLASEDAHHYRLFRFDEAGAIRACFVFLRIEGAVAERPAEELALAEAVQSALLWAPAAFAERSPLALLPDGRAVLRPEVADLMRAAYDPVMPAAAGDASHALRLFARLQGGGAGA